MKIPTRIKKVGVFVNASFEEIKNKVKDFDLDYLQLHGDETSLFCQRLKEQGYRVIKAFRINDHFDFNLLNNYAPYCDYFLLDAKGKSYGGNGIQFNWEVLKQYNSSKPFFLSGGIDLESVPAIQKLDLEQLTAIDINSKFEIRPAKKDIQKIKKFIQKVQTL